MNQNENEVSQTTTAQKVKQQPGWENMDDKLAEDIARGIKRLAEIFYVTIAREMNLNPMDKANDLDHHENSKRKCLKKKKRVEV